MNDSKSESKEAAYILPTIDRVDVSAEKIADFKSEQDYLGLSLDLMVEVGSYLTIAINILGPDGTWTRDQAAIGGNLVRLYKLLSAMLDQTVQHRRETSFILARLAFETIVATRYLLKERNPGLVDSYVKHSLSHEQRLLEVIDKNITARNGIALPIEDRMRRSIARLFKSSGIAIGGLSAKKERDWGGKNLFEKAEAVGLADAYLGMFAGVSLNVHGAWGDLYTYHLNHEAEGRFSPNIEWGRPRPQPLFSVALLSLDIVEDFALFMGATSIADQLAPKLDDLRDRLMDADQAHESYLGRKSWPSV